MALDTEMSTEDLNEILASVSGDATPIPPKATPKPAAAVAEADLDELAGALAEIDSLPEPPPEVEAPTDDDLEALIGSEPEAPSAPPAEPKVSADAEPVVVVKVDPDLEAALEEIDAVVAEAEPSVEEVEQVVEETPVSVEAAPTAAEIAEIAASAPEPKVTGVVYYIDAEMLKRDLAINPADIDSALMSHASNFVHYAVQAAQARRQFDKTKAAFEILESRLDHRHREVLKLENPKTTEAQIRAAVVSDPVWSQGNTRLIETRSIYELSQDAKEAFMMRRDTLLQLAKDAREERVGQLRVMGMDSAKERVMETLRGKSELATA